MTMAEYQKQPRHKHAARRLAAEQNVPTLAGTAAPTSLEQAREFMADLGPGGAVMVKAVAGGGGRGMRPVLDALAIEHHTCQRLDELEEIVDRTIRQAISTQAPACLIMSPLLTGGKAVKK